MKIGLFTDAFNTKGHSFEENYNKTGQNSGNLVFLRSIKKLFDPVILNPYYGYHNKSEEYSDIDAFITTDLIWIRPNTEMSDVECIFNHIGNRPLIPISVGLQADATTYDFEMHPKTVKLLQAISERCTIGVRGYYAAYILNKNKIKNIAVIGCPSVFYLSEYHFKTPDSKKSIQAISSFRTAFYPDFHKWCSKEELDFLTFCSSYNMGFVEQTGMNQISSTERFGAWINNQRKMFFDTSEWDAYVRNYDFHIGMRFHGGIIAMQNGLRSLFLTKDSRTNELTDFFCLPKMSIQEFDSSKSLEYYYEKADYSEFNKRFSYLKENFYAFARSNGLISKI